MKTCPVVLVADDEVADVALLQRAVAKARTCVRFDFVHDGVETLNYLQSCPPSSLPEVLLLDLKMPRMNGFEVLQCLRRWPHLRPATVGVLSSAGDWEAIHRASELGVDHYFVKPSSPDDLIAMVKQLEQYCPEPPFVPLLVPAPGAALHLAPAAAA